MKPAARPHFERAAALVVQAEALCSGGGCVGEGFWEAVALASVHAQLAQVANTEHAHPSSLPRGRRA